MALLSLKLLIYVPWFLTTPKQNDSEAIITDFTFMKDYYGNYTFSYETSNGIFRHETGTSVNFNETDAYTQINGTLSYKELNNKTRIVRYTADNKGYNWTNDGKRIHSTKIISPISLELLVYVPSALASHPHEKDGKIRSFTYTNDGRGGYNMSYETTNAVTRKEMGTVVNAGKPDEQVTVHGSVKYETANNQEEGVRYQGVEYILDSDGLKIMEFEEGYLGVVNVHSLIQPSGAVIYTYEDVELRRIFPSEFPQDTVRKTGNVDAEHLGRYAELENYFRFPKSKLNSHFEEMTCFDQKGKRLCQVDFARYSADENSYYMSQQREDPMDPRRVYCIFLLCFTKDELDKVVNTF